MVHGYLNWRDSEGTKREYSFKSGLIKEYDFFKLESSPSTLLEQGKDHFILLNSWNEYNSIKIEGFWDRIALEVTSLVPGIEFGFAEMSRATIESEWPYPTP